MLRVCTSTYNLGKGTIQHTGVIMAITSVLPRTFKCYPLASEFWDPITCPLIPGTTIPPYHILLIILVCVGGTGILPRPALVRQVLSLRKVGQCCLLSVLLSEYGKVIWETITILMDNSRNSQGFSRGNLGPWRTWGSDDWSLTSRWARTIPREGGCHLTVKYTWRPK